MHSYTRSRVAALSFVMAGLLAFSAAPLAATVALRDGTVIHGEIRSMQNDIYTIESDSLGTIRVPKQEIRSIDEGGKPARAAGLQSSTQQPSLGASELDATESRIMQDPKLLAMVLSLQSDPDVEAVLADPDITKAMAAGDYASLLNNPKIIALMHNAKMREIIDGVQ